MAVAGETVGGTLGDGVDAVSPVFKDIPLLADAGVHSLHAITSPSGLCGGCLAVVELPQDVIKAIDGV